MRVSSAMPYNSCIVTVEGFQVSNDYIVKELTVMFDSDNYQHFFFDCPPGLIIGPSDERTIRYTENLNGLRLENDSYIPYSIIGYILGKLDKYVVYTAGNQAATFLSRYLPQTMILDACQEFNFKYPLELQQMPCFYRHSSRYCSLSKAVTLKIALQVLQVN